MSHKEKAEMIVERARSLAESVESWADFSNAVSDPDTGLIAKTFPDSKERGKFFDSPEYETINRMLTDLIKRFGIADGATPTKSGKFLVRVPRTLHTVLDVEARSEGVSLNQLAVAKLSVRLRESTSLSASLLVEAFTKVHDGYAQDRVVVDPAINSRFLKECRSLGLPQSDYALNHALLDIRKSKKAKLPATTKRTEFRDYDEYEFASEIAFRHLQRAEGVSLDRVLCDPQYTRLFDELALKLAPSQPVLKLRCAALNLRKTHRLKPGDLYAPLSSRMIDLVSAGPASEISLDEVPAFPGLYVFYMKTRPIFAGETSILRRRIGQHLDQSDRLGLPDWLGVMSDRGLELRFHAAPSFAREERLGWLNRFINAERPVLNYQRAA